jgi:CheY-like chemotaxis protein
MADVLEAEGYRVAISGNGADALEQLRSADRPDLILLDMMMPVMDGWKFRQEQQTMTDVAAIPVVTVTADGDARGKAHSINAAGYLAKPVTIDALLDQVERICGQPNA